jgi:hypothetical protein
MRIYLIMNRNMFSTVALLLLVLGPTISLPTTAASTTKLAQSNSSATVGDFQNRNLMVSKVLDPAIRDELVNLDAHTPPYSYTFQFGDLFLDGVKDSDLDDLIITSIEIDPQNKIVILTGRTPEPIVGNQVDPISIKITPFGKFTLSFLNQKTSIVGHIESEILEGDKHALAFVWQNLPNCISCPVDAAKPEISETTRRIIYLAELAPYNKKFPTYIYVKKHEQAVIGYITNEENTDPKSQYFVFGTCQDGNNPWQKCEGVFVGPGDHDDGTFLMKRNDGYYGWHVMRNDKIYMHFEVEGRLEPLEENPTEERPIGIKIGNIFFG